MPGPITNSIALMWQWQLSYVIGIWGDKGDWVDKGFEQGFLGGKGGMAEAGSLFGSQQLHLYHFTAPNPPHCFLFIFCILYFCVLSSTYAPFVPHTCIIASHQVILTGISPLFVLVKRKYTVSRLYMLWGFEHVYLVKYLLYYIANTTVGRCTSDLANENTGQHTWKIGTG